MSSEFDNKDNINTDNATEIKSDVDKMMDVAPSNEGDDFDDLSVIDISSDVEYQLNQERTGVEVVKLEPNKSKRKLNSFDIFFVRVWTAIVSAIAVVSSGISKGFFKLFKKELPERYVTAFISIILIILVIVIVLSPFHLTMGNGGTIQIFGDSLIPVARTNSNGELRWGYVNKSGRELIPFEYYNANPFYHKVAFVQTNATTWQILGANGVLNDKLLVKTDSNNPSKQVVGDFNNPERLAWIAEGEQYRYVKTNGTYAFGDKKYKRAESFSHGYALVQSGQVWYFINNKGKPKSPEYLEAKSFSEGLAAVKKNSGWTFVDTKFKEINPDITYTAVTSFHNGYAWVRRSDAVNLIDKNGKLLLPNDYNGMKPSDEDLRELGLEIQ